ncbi:MAG: hypothetical protein JSV91_10430 [Phycisphaerales bacterium]|nr:MAG: hypothetical protein JSV91_10430 [Phycisphaerales bacterium]
MRRLGVILVLLLVAVLANIINAWSCALLVAVHEDDPDSPAIAVQSVGNPPEAYFYEMRRAGAFRRVEWEAMEWGALSGGGEVDDPPVVEDARGLPMLSLSCRIHTMSDTADCYAVEVEGGIGIANIHDPATIAPGPGMLPQNPDFYSALVLPCRPMWPGFVINTLIYAAVLWLLLRGLPAVRRAVRAFNGRCTNCGYDLRGTPGTACPECGWGRAAWRSASRA